MITSRTNEKVKEVCELVKSAAARKKSGMYVVEGPRMVREIPADMMVSIYASFSFMERSDIAKEIPGINPADIAVTSDEVFEKMSATNSPQGILAICRAQEHSLDEIISRAQGEADESQAKPLLIIEGIQDPGNLGTMFRSAEAAGAGGIIMDTATADPFNPKVIRSTMGSVFRVPFVRNQEFLENIKKIKSAGYTLYAAHLGGEVLGEFKPERLSAFLIGNEGNGLSTGVSGLSDALIKIPMEGKVESLNASVAASLLLYEWHRAYK